MADFSNHIVNKRFRLVFNDLEKNNLIKGKSDIAHKLGTYNHVINSILKGKRNITVDQLNKLFDIYNINANFMFGLEDVMYQNGEHASDIPAFDIGDVSYSGKKNITLVPLSAKAGPSIDFSDAATFLNLPKFSIPNLEGDLYAFEISGDSMMPTVTNGDMVICEKVESGGKIYDNNVYVIITDQVVAKRIQQIRTNDQSPQLRLISDNKEVYQPYSIDAMEIRQLFRVKCRLTSYAIN